MTEDVPNEAVIALRLRLKAVEAEMDDLYRRENALSSQRQRLFGLKRALQDALDKEEDLLTPLDPTAIPEMHPAGGEDLSDLLLAVLKSGPKNLTELKELGKRWAPLQDSNFPGRALNFALVGLQKGGHVERTANGYWKLGSGQSQK